MPLLSEGQLNRVIKSCLADLCILFALNQRHMSQAQTLAHALL